MERSVNDVVKQLTETDKHLYPKKKSEKRYLRQHLISASSTEPVKIYVGSCPDYSNNGEVYTHENIGSGVPLLTRVHLDNDQQILKVLSKNKVPFKYTVMVADVEAEDEVFCNRFTNGDRQEFIGRCRASVEATRNLLNGNDLGGYIKSSSFYQEFGKERFLDYQLKYQNLLLERYKRDSSFVMRVNGDLLARMDIYRKMYRGLIDTMTSVERNDFLVGRTIRTMAQYLTLGRLIGEDAKHPVIICHPTRNIGLFNGRNKFVLPEDGVHPQPTIPVFELKKGVY